ncbi:MAG: HTH domain-containing protein [Syntrophobacteraceae bacterium]
MEPEFGSEKSLEKSPREDEGSLKSSLKSSLKTEDQILELIRRDASVTTERMGEILDISKRAVLKQIQKLKAQGRLKRVGPDKAGHWEVVE